MNYDSKNNEFVFDTLIAVPGLSKDRLFARCKEFLAINYGNINAVLHYEDNENGRMICKGNVRTNASREYSVWEVLGFSLSSADVINRSWFTLRIFIDDGYVRVKITDISFDQERTVPLIAFFPIVMNPTLVEMRGAYALTKNTNQVLRNHLIDWVGFVQNTELEDDWH